MVTETGQLHLKERLWIRTCLEEKITGEVQTPETGALAKLFVGERASRLLEREGIKTRGFGEGQSAGDLGSEVVCGEVSGENIVEVREGGGKEIIAVAGGERERVGKCKSAYKFYGIDAVVGKERLIGGEKDGVADGGNGIFKDVAG